MYIENIVIGSQIVELSTFIANNDIVQKGY